MDFNKIIYQTNSLNEKASPLTSLKQGLTTGLLDSTISAYPLIQKCRIQAGVKTQQHGERKFIAGFIFSNTMGHSISSINHPLSTLCSSAISVVIETITRPGITGSKIRPTVLPFMALREGSFWGGIQVTNHLIKSGDSNPVNSFLFQALFSGIIGNLFDTLTGYTSAKETTILDTCHWAIKSPKEVISIYKRSLPSRMIGCVLTPWLAIEATKHPKSPLNVLKSNHS
ncbi:MAG: hypothetical protein VW397_02440 [Candidatus Margulisiibacteriota bacterium]